MDGQLDGQSDSTSGGKLDGKLDGESDGKLADGKLADGKLDGKSDSKSAGKLDGQSDGKPEGKSAAVTSGVLAEWQNFVHTEVGRRVGLCFVIAVVIALALARVNFVVHKVSAGTHAFLATFPTWF